MSSYEYHQILQFLYFEGYADSYEEAEELVESLSDDEFQDLIEDDSWKERNFRPLSKTKKARVTGFLNSQMIKLKDYSNQADIAQDELKNPDYSKPPRVKIGTLLKKMKTGSKLMSNAQQARKRTTEREEGRNNIRKFKREDIEYILDTLISEGFAVDYDSAGCILEAMSDDEFEELNEIRAQKPWSAAKIRRFNKEQERQKRQLKRTPGSSLRPEDQKALKRITARLAGDEPEPQPEPQPESRGREPSPTRSASRTIKRSELSDIIKNQFDLVADYLFSEGYADSLDGAEVMAESISDNWVNEILDEEYKDLTPEKEERVKNRVGELVRDIQVQSGRMKDLKKKPFGKYRPKVKQEKEAILKSARKKQKLVQNASDALIRTSTSRSASIQKRIQDLKDQ